MPTPSSLLADAIHQLQLLALNPVRRPGRREIYDLADGTSCLIRTGPKGTAMTKAESPDAASLMPMLEGEKAPDFYVFATPAPRNNGPTEVYKFPCRALSGTFGQITPSSPKRTPTRPISARFISVVARRRTGEAIARGTASSCCCLTSMTANPAIGTIPPKCRRWSLRYDGRCMPLLPSTVSRPTASALASG